MMKLGNLVGRCISQNSQLSSKFSIIGPILENSNPKGDKCIILQNVNKAMGGHGTGCL